MRGPLNVKLPGLIGAAGGLETRQFCACFCLSNQYHYLSIVQINHFRQSPSHLATQECFPQFSVETFSWSDVAGEWGGGRKNFSAGPDPAPGSPVQNLYSVVFKAENIL